MLQQLSKRYLSTGNILIWKINDKETSCAKSLPGIVLFQAWLVIVPTVVWLRIVESFANRNIAVPIGGANPLENNTKKKKNSLPFNLKENLTKLTFNIRDRANVIFCRQYEFIVNDPFWFMIQTRRRMQLHDLIILNGQIMACSF